MSKDKCIAAQLAATEVCNCTMSDRDQDVLEFLSSFVGSAIFDEGTAEYAAGRYLIEEDPLYNEEMSIRRSQQVGKKSGTTNSTEGISSTITSTSNTTASNKTSDTDKDVDETEGSTPTVVNVTIPVNSTSTTSPVVNETEPVNVTSPVVNGTEPSNATSPVVNGTEPVDSISTTPNNTSCPICPDGMEIQFFNSSLPANSLPETLSDFADLNCSGLEMASLENSIPIDACPIIQNVSKVACGCYVNDSVTNEPQDGPNEEEGTDNTSVDPSILQRYLMILFYYQTSNMTESPWENGCDPQSLDPCEEINRTKEEAGGGTSRWLSQLSECEWAGITCEDDVIKGIELGTFVHG